MGWGDEVLTTGIVKKAKLRHPDKSICVGDGHNAIWNEVFDHNPKISKEIDKSTLWVKSYPGNRPYIKQILPGRMIWNESFHVEPGEIYFSPEELRHAHSDFVYIEPNVKGEVYKNKDWGFDNWQKVVNALPEIKFIQGKGRRLENVLQVDTLSFRDACALLSRAFLFVGTDGGLHHAAAALGVPAVVVWGGLINPKITGYPSQTILCEARTFCGKLSECDHCKEALSKVAVDKVVKAICTFK